MGGYSEISMGLGIAEIGLGAFESTGPVWGVERSIGLGAAGVDRSMGLGGVCGVAMTMVVGLDTGVEILGAGASVGACGASLGIEPTSVGSMLGLARGEDSAAKSNESVSSSLPTGEGDGRHWAGLGIGD